MIRGRTKIVAFGVSTLAGAVLAVMILISVNASLLKIPEMPVARPTPSRTLGQVGDSAEPDYNAVIERNLFRAKLQVEIPKPKTEQEIEEEALAGIVKGMALKGVMLGLQTKDNYAVIDRGGQKGVWTYENGDIIERGLILKEIKKDSIKLEKGEFAAVLKLFSPVYERTPGTAPVAQQGSPASKSPEKSPDGKAKIDLGKNIRNEGSVTLISKSLAEKLKTDNNMIMSSVAVKAAADGLKVVAVDRGSIAQRMGIAPDDTLQEVNGYKLNSSEDMNKVYDALKNSTQFSLKVLRRGRSETLRYEIR
jgi:type II secretory pathway component PulC